jgi:hypothetical protein
MAEDIGPIYTTKIPALSEAADIQAALKLYHYGTVLVPTTENDVIPTSVAGYIQSLENALEALDTREEARGIGQSFQTEEPTSPVDNYIWVKSDSSPTAIAELPTSRYQESQPTENLTAGLLWVDSDSTPLTMYVYSGTAWREIGA